MSPVSDIETLEKMYLDRLIRFHDELITKKIYTVFDIHRAEYLLEPIICIWCYERKNVIYDQKLGDGYCENCGRWQLEPLEEKYQKEFYKFDYDPELKFELLLVFGF